MVRSCGGVAFRLLLVLCLAIAPFGLWAEGSAEAGQSPGSGPTPVLTYFEGMVRIDGARPEFGQTVPLGSRVETGRGSYCEIVFNSKNILRIGENTIAIVSVDLTHRDVDLKLGAVGAVLDKLETVTSGGAFRVATPSAVAGVRGTVFYIEVESQEVTYACTCNGAIVYTDPSGKGRIESSATHHSAHRFTKSNDGFLEETAPLLYHDDAFMDAIAAKVGVTIPWE